MPLNHHYFSYFRRFERYVDDPSYPQVDSSLRGKDGPVRIGYFNYHSDTGAAFINASVNVGIPHTADFNDGKSTLGVSRVCCLSHIFLV
jgi:choline dehydrogenase